jgi:AraC-like DNA-binding protein
MPVEFAAPSAALAPYISVFYLFRDDSERIDDIDRADVGQIRFMLRGSGAFTFANGNVEPSCPVILNGPGSGAASYRVDGPFFCFGAALRPLGWAAIIGTPADAFADRVNDGTAVLGDDATDLLNRLRALDTLADMVACAEPVFEAWVKPVDPDHVALIEKVRVWLADSAIPDVNDLMADLDWSPRQAVRLVKRYYGAPPKLLARKMRALRAATALIEHGHVASDLAASFYDQSHMIREIRHFTGRTPTRLLGGEEPILRTTLTRANFRELKAP